MRTPFFASTRIKAQNRRSRRWKASAFTASPAASINAPRLASKFGCGGFDWRLTSVSGIGGEDVGGIVGGGGSGAFDGDDPGVTGVESETSSVSSTAESGRVGGDPLWGSFLMNGDWIGPVSVLTFSSLPPGLRIVISALPMSLLRRTGAGLP